MIVTRNFLLKHRTKEQAWTKAQMDVLGLPWPPKKGWIGRIKDMELDQQQVEDFIKGAGIKIDSTIPRLKDMLRKLNSDELEHMKKWIERL